MAENYTLVLIDRQEIVPNVCKFIFQKPKKFTFQAGQYIKAIVPIDHDDGHGNSRFFTISSSPTESDLFITTKMQDSEFKRKLYRLEKGDTLDIRGPYGSFVLDPSDIRNKVFISGGLGITPFRSMIKEIVDLKSNHRIQYFISFTQMSEAPFLQELLTITKENASIQIIPFFTQDITDMVSYEKGRITQDKLNTYVEKLHESVYYITGPTEMVDAVSSSLKLLGIREDVVFKEYFSGYQYE